MASYVIEAPVWKTSYRLLLTPGKSFLQGWALIDNTQDEDWNGVTLTLVSGKPNAFTHDLYSPRFRQRPVLKVNEDAPQMGIARLGDRSLGSFGAAGVFRRHEPDEGHDAGRTRETSGVTELGGNRERREVVNAAETAQALHAIA